MISWKFISLIFTKVTALVHFWKTNASDFGIKRSKFMRSWRNKICWIKHLAGGSIQYLTSGIELKYLVRPPGTTVPDGLMFCPWCFFCSTPNLRGPSADRHETLPHDRNLAVLYNPSPKIQGALPKKYWGPKTCKISVDFLQRPSLIANISGTA